MNYTFPSTFPDYDSWVEYTENLRREWVKSKFWDSFTPEKWIEEFPEMQERVTQLYLEKLDLVSRLKEDFILTEQFFSKDLNTRIFEEAQLDTTLGAVINSLEKKIKVYARMLAILNPKQSNNEIITERDIDVARNYPIADLLPELPKRGFIICPFHKEKTPSCKVFTDHIHCFGCGKHINSIGYLMETQNKTFIDSVKFLCQK
jgi:hypothetical protein